MPPNNSNSFSNAPPSTAHLNAWDKLILNLLLTVRWCWIRFLAFVLGLNLPPWLTLEVFFSLLMVATLGVSACLAPRPEPGEERGWDGKRGGGNTLKERD